MSAFHLLDAGDAGPHMLMVDGSRLYAITPAFRDQLRAAAPGARTTALLQSAGLFHLDFVPAADVPAPQLRAISLAVAQRCNLGCTYCYAEGGSFGDTPRDMPWPVAEASVRRLIEGAAPGEQVNIAFLGGEPLTNRALITQTVNYAETLAAPRGIRVGFSITTNGTLLSEADGALFTRHPFAVTVSLDGIGPVHDRLRPAKGGQATFGRIAANVARLLAAYPGLRLAARVTVTPANLNLRETLEGLLALGFASVGFAPLLHAPGGQQAMAEDHIPALLDAMIACGREYERRALAGQSWGFANLETALREIHRGTHRPYPCGAGAAYMAVSADGDLAACHRFVGDAERRMGDVATGIDPARQQAWLHARRVERQSPCATCWARNLCGGGCHYEAIHAGRPACDYIRGWLDYALGAYARLKKRQEGLLF